MLPGMSIGARPVRTSSTRQRFCSCAQDRCPARRSRPRSDWIFKTRSKASQHGNCRTHAVTACIADAVWTETREYAAALHRARTRLKSLRQTALVLQFGGAAGTLAALGDNGLEISEHLAKELSLPLPDVAMAHPPRPIADVAANFAILTGTCGKIARDVSLLMQTDVGEAFEPSGEGKRRIVHPAPQTQSRCCHGYIGCSHDGSQSCRNDFYRAGARSRAQCRSLARGMADTADFMLVTSGALAAIAELAEGLEIDTDRMRANLDSTHGLVMAEAVSMALAAKIGKADAHAIVEAASRTSIASKRHLRDVLLADECVTAHIDASKLSAAIRADVLSGRLTELIDRILASLDT